MSAHQYIESGIPVPGWFDALDAWVMVAADTAQVDSATSGDLLEVGVYAGRSAVLIGFLRHAGEQFYACDLFGQPAGIADNDRESERLYRGLEASGFLENFAKYHDVPAELVVGRSDLRLPELRERSFRFIHIDGAHTFDAVRADIVNARRLLMPDGIVVFDDIAQVTTAPGVPAAVWEAVAVVGLVPLALTNCKLYATWDTTGNVAARFEAALRSSSRVSVVDTQRVGDSNVLILRSTTGGPATWRTLAHRLAPPITIDLYRRLREGIRAHTRK